MSKTTLALSRRHPRRHQYLTRSMGMLSAALPPPCATCSTLVMFQIAATQCLRMFVVPTRQRSSSARTT